MDPQNLPDGSKHDMDFKKASEADSKAWKDIWGAGQGVGAIKEVPGAAELIDRLEREYLAARERLGLAAARAAAE